MNRSHVDDLVENLFTYFYNTPNSINNPKDFQKISIYMNYDFWSECMLNIRGGVSQAAHEFYQTYSSQGQQTLCGCKVYVVSSECVHPPYIFHYER